MQLFGVSCYVGLCSPVTFNVTSSNLIPLLTKICYVERGVCPIAALNVTN